MDVSHVANVTESHQKRWGQYFTPAEVAQFMAQVALHHLGVLEGKTELKVLDIGAGCGMLTAAVCEAIANTVPSVTQIRVVVYEMEPKAAALLRECLETTRVWLGTREHTILLDAEVRVVDFLRDGVHLSRDFDICVSNPPYFKVSPADEGIRKVRSFLGDSAGAWTNIYATFMALGSYWLRERGVAVFITPRSFASGVYFANFRIWMTRHMLLRYVHVFGSRGDAFSKDSVLQENVITAWMKTCDQEQRTPLAISHSAGVSDLAECTPLGVPYSMAVVTQGDGIALHFPETHEDLRVLGVIDAWRDGLASLGLSVSTGPIVAFRAANYLVDADKTAYPLLWMQNVHPMRIVWPNSLNKHKEFIKKDLPFHARGSLLVPVRTMVLLRRFSPKEQERRIISAAFCPEELGLDQYDYIGLENHLNYIVRIDGRELTKSEAHGLSALLMCSTVDRYFRLSSGNTQVSSMELRILPLPPPTLISKIGDALLASGDQSFAKIDMITAKLLLEGETTAGNESVAAAPEETGTSIRRRRADGGRDVPARRPRVAPKNRTLDSYVSRT